MQLRQLGNYAVQATRQLCSTTQVQAQTGSDVSPPCNFPHGELVFVRGKMAINVVALGVQSGEQASQGGAWAASSCSFSPAPPSDCFTYLTIIDLAMHDQEDFQIPKHF